MPETYDAYRALARALARLAPVYRQRMLDAAARALADGDGKAARRFSAHLDDADRARARAAAAQIAGDRDVAVFDDAIRRSKAAIVRCVRRLIGYRRSLHPPTKRRQPTNQ